MLSGAVTFELFDEGDLDKLLAANKERQSEKDDARLLCATCGCVITSPSQRISVDGSHHHTFTNPVGLVFEIGCFRDAPGCRQAGSATGDWTWFDGFSWRIAVCHQCQSHLGWSYQSNDSEGFFGLIVDRLVSPG
jgi:hypothetical protein